MTTFAAAPGITFFNLCATMYELLIDSPAAQPNKSKPRFTSEGEAFLKQALSQGKGAIIFTPHTGNFFYYYWHLSQKISLHDVATAQSQELRPIYLRFEQMGCKGLDYDITPPLQMMRKLRGHLQENGVVLLLGDFYRPNFPPSTLFGKPTRSPMGAAVLALEQQAPVIPFYGCRSDGFNHKLVFGKPLHLHEEFERHQRSEATNRLNKTLEDAIALVPDQWFYWFNAEERWQPEGGGKELAEDQDTVWLKKRYGSVLILAHEQ